jgi:glycine/D-amino acid oxidase-like deaminating enzyme
VYLAVMHSGITLAPVAGALAAQEIMGGPPAEALSGFRPGRTFEVTAGH